MIRSLDGDMSHQHSYTRGLYIFDDRLCAPDDGFSMRAFSILEALRDLSCGPAPRFSGLHLKRTWT